MHKLMNLVAIIGLLGMTANVAGRLMHAQVPFSYLGQRFLGSNHIRRPQRVCRTMCG